VTVGDAVTVLGIKRVKMVALGFAMMSSMTRHPHGLLNVKQLWRHSMAVALAMDALSQAMPRAMRPADEEIYLAGLLHDIGFLVLEYIEPELSNQFHARLLTGQGLQDTEVEAEMLEMNHCELGALLAERWNLTASIVAVLRLHHTDGLVMDAPGQPLVAMTNLAEKLLPTFNAGERTSSDVSIEDWQALGVDAGQVEEVEAVMRLRAEEIAAAFS
jgi:putative nucleotidyltransferase with HDIG domain